MAAEHPDPVRIRGGRPFRRSGKEHEARRLTLDAVGSREHPNWARSGSQYSCAGSHVNDEGKQFPGLVRPIRTDDRHRVRHDPIARARRKCRRENRSEHHSCHTPSATMLALRHRRVKRRLCTCVRPRRSHLEASGDFGAPTLLPARRVARAGFVAFILGACRSSHVLVLLDAAPPRRGASRRSSSSSSRAAVPALRRREARSLARSCTWPRGARTRSSI